MKNILIIMLMFTSFIGMCQKVVIKIDKESREITVTHNEKIDNTILYYKILFDSSGIQHINDKLMAKERFDSLVVDYINKNKYISIEYGVFLSKFNVTQYFVVDYSFENLLENKKTVTIILKNKGVIAGEF